MAVTILRMAAGFTEAVGMPDPAALTPGGQFLFIQMFF